jgi:hypothetical protein
MTRAGEYPVTAETGPLRIGGDRIELDVHVRSASDRSLLVVEEVRAIHWDRSKKSVEIWLSDARSPGVRQGVCRAVFKPNTRELPARGSVTIAVSIPRHLFRIQPEPGGKVEIDHADLGEAKTVSVHVTVADQPFYYRPAGPHPRAQLAKWGQTVRTKTTIPRPPRPGGMSAD